VVIEIVLMVTLTQAEQQQAVILIELAAQACLFRTLEKTVKLTDHLHLIIPTLVRYLVALVKAVLKHIGQPVVMIIHSAAADVIALVHEHI
jgi:hypothetical protein